MQYLVAFGCSFLKEDGHPNEKGHQLFVDHLINYIDRVIMHKC
jgi:lysophospholipase L1-like esterase